MSWVLMSFIAMVGIAPAVLMTGVAEKHFGISPDIFAIIWFGPTVFGMTAWILINGRGSELVTATASNMGIVILIIAFVISSLANIMVFKAFAAAPNPGLPIGIVNLNALVAFAATPALAKLFPRFFEQPIAHPMYAVGILLGIASAVILSVKWG